MVRFTTLFTFVRSLLHGIAVVLAVVGLDTATAQPAEKPHVIVPGYERFRADRLSDVDAGKLLISELNCQSCHGSILQETLPQRRAPVLTAATSRIIPEHLRTFIADPQATKPGTAMPQVLRGPDSKHAIEALTHFLAADGATMPSPVSGDAIDRGRKLFQSIGCAACHGDQEKPAASRPVYAMPLGNPDTKYTVGSLIEFLKNPHAVRPSGRMPSLNLTDDEARDIANYLLQHIDVEPNLTFEYFEGNWNNLPDFDKLKPNSAAAPAVLMFERRPKRISSHCGSKPFCMSRKTASTNCGWAATTAADC